MAPKVKGMSGSSNIIGHEEPVETSQLGSASESEQSSHENQSSGFEQRKSLIGGSGQKRRQWQCQSQWTWANGKARSTEVHGKAASMVLLQPGETLCLCGYVELAVLQGEAEVIGFKATPSQSFWPVYSPTSSSMVNVIGKGDSAQIPRLEATLLVSWLGAQAADVAEKMLSANQNNKLTLLLFKSPSAETARPVLSAVHLKPLRALFSLEHSMAASASQKNPLNLDTCEVILDPREGVRAFEAPQKWHDFAEQLLAFAGTPVVVLAGAKDTGKSALGRFLLNQMLSKHKVIAYLDCDCGQGEFSPPGMLALTLRSAPVLGPPAFHLQPSLRCLYVGGHTPRSNPVQFVKCVASLLDTYHTHPSCKNVPLLVNTCGWIKGIGDIILRTITSLACPTHVAQLLVEDSPPALSMALLTNEILSSTRRDNVFGLFPLEPLANEIEATKWEIVLLDYLLTGPTTVSARYLAADHRLMAYAAYFNTATPLAEQPSVVVPFNQIAVCIGPDTVTREDLFYAINGEIVGLMTGTGLAPLVSPENPTANQNPRSAAEISSSSCIGLGVIRAVDTANQLLHIITPLTLSELKTVDAVAKGAMPMPCALMEDRSIYVHNPFVSLDSAVTGSLPRKKKSVVKRRSLAHSQ